MHSFVGILPLVAQQNIRFESVLNDKILIRKIIVGNLRTLILILMEIGLFSGSINLSKVFEWWHTLSAEYLSLFSECSYRDGCCNSLIEPPIL